MLLIEKDAVVVSALESRYLFDAPDNPNVFGKIDRRWYQPWRAEALAELSEIRHNASRLSIIYLCQ